MVGLTAIHIVNIQNQHQDLDATNWRSGVLPDLAYFTPNLIELELTHSGDAIVPSCLNQERMRLPPNLRILELAYCCLVDFEVDLPQSLRVVNLSFNRLSRVPVCLEGIRDLVMGPSPSSSPSPSPSPSTCRLNLRNNNFWFDEGSNIPISRVNTDTLVELSRAHEWGLLNAAKLHSAIALVGRHQDVTKRVAKHKTVYADGQNVHIHGVRSSVQAALVLINDATSNIPFDCKFVDAFARRMKLPEPMKSHFRRHCADSCVHAVHKATFGGICERLFAFASLQDNADDVFRAMGDEYTRNFDVCLTGKITHILTALNGIVEGFAIGMDAKTEIGSTLAHIRNKWSDLAGDDFTLYVTNSIPEAMQALEDACIPAEQQHEWLAGI